MPRGWKRSMVSKSLIGTRRRLLYLQQHASFASNLPRSQSGGQSEREPRTWCPYFRPAFRTENYRHNYETCHSRLWKQYSAAPDEEKQYIFRSSRSC
ncbi:hypothetical protein JG688_00016492 [Phytophthora aleatoria]|uniref:Uncharacterized protein n=1 Tax=Phytophthora aleatoria TaxID=2496075 RepID=A0A8J5LW65_9STRA|nr:hypothetical protein JG688_00016492 [Phytophthora aleatoria]